MIKEKIHIVLVSFLICAVFSVNAQDVIIKKDGLIIHADLVEVGLEVIKYKKSAYPDGPVFSIPVNEVYAIAYGDYSTDYYVLPETNEPFNNEDQQQEEDTIDNQTTTVNPMTEQAMFTNSRLFNNIEASFGVGIVNTYSEAEEGIEDLNKKSIMPSFNIRVWTGIKENLQTGLQLSLAKFNFERDRFNSYDEVVILSDIDENVLSLIGFVRYNFQGELFRPYGLAGIGFTRSNIHTQRNLSFIEEGGPVFNINSYAQTINFAIMLRGGVSVLALEDISFYADAGTGITIFQLGIQFKFK